MSFFHVRTLPGYSWPALADAAISQAWVAYLQLERTQWLSSAELQSQQLEQARGLLAHCVGYVPYYRDILPKAGIVPGAMQTLHDFRRLPFLSRRTYQERFAEFATLRLPAGMVATGTRPTAGKTGPPVAVLQTNLVNLWWCAFYLRDLEWAGIDPTGTLAWFRANLKKNISLPHWLPMLDPVIASGPSHGMELHQAPLAQMQWLRCIAPHYLSSSPAHLEILAQLVRQQGPLPGLQAIQSSGESLTEEARAAIETAFGVPVVNTYRCTEAGYLASPCPEGNGLHVHAENVLLEVLDEKDQPCPPEETGRVVVTDLHNFRGPFLRYELGDEATQGPLSCSCGRGLPLLLRVRRR